MYRVLLTFREGAEVILSTDDADVARNWREQLELNFGKSTALKLNTKTGRHIGISMKDLVLFDCVGAEEEFNDVSETPMENPEHPQASDEKSKTSVTQGPKTSAKAD